MGGLGWSASFFEGRTIMEKFLVLSLVLGLVSLASGGFVITTDGTTELDPTGEMAPTSMTLGVASDATMVMFEGHTLALIVNDSAATITGGEVMPIEDFMGTIPGSVNTGVTILNPPGTNGVWMTVLCLDEIPPQVLFDNFVLTCTGAGVNAVVELYEIYEGEPFVEPYDTLVIGQVPEPTTIALFALGGLFLRRGR
jgi:hypothetical protein